MIGVPTAAALAATLLVAVLATPDRPGSTGDHAVSDAAAAVLLRAASASTSTSTPQASQYWRAEIREVTIKHGESDTGAPVGATYRIWSSRTIYTAVDASRPTWIEEFGATKVEQLSGPTGEGAPTASHTAWTDDLPANKFPASWQAPTTAFLAELPRDTTALRERLYHDAAGHGSSTDSEVWTLALDVLRTGLVPADLTASLLRVLATVPGISLVQPSAPLDGRATEALTFDVSLVDPDGVAASQYQLVTDQASGAVLGQRLVLIEPFLGQPVGTVIGLTRTSLSVVDDVPASVRAIAFHQHCEVQVEGGVVCEMPR